MDCCQSSLVRTLWSAVCVLGLASLTATQQNLATTAHVLIYSATAEFRHDSIPTAIQAMVSEGPSYNIHFDNTEDQTWFTDGRINEYDALVFLDNTGQGKHPGIVWRCPNLIQRPTPVLDNRGEAALESYVNSGGNFVGLHSASDCQRNSSFYQKELGTFGIRSFAFRVCRRKIGST